MSEYVADPSLAEVPLHLNEVELLLSSEGKLLAKDPRKVHHFTRRVLATMQLSKQQIQALHRDVQDIQLKQQRAGTATTLSPLDAVKYLTAEQLQQVFGAVARQQMEFLRRQQAEAQSAARAVNADRAKLKFAVATLMEDTSIPAELRAKFDNLLKRMPGEADESGPAPLPEIGQTPAPAAPPSGSAPTNAAQRSSSFQPAALPHPDAPQAALAPGAHRAMASPYSGAQQGLRARP